MEIGKTWNRKIAMVGWSVLFIWWGTAILIKPITIGMTAVGTGLVLLGANAARLLKGLPAKRSNTAIGIMAILWGSLDHVLKLSFDTSSAVLMIVIGTVALGFLLIRPAAD